jgi:hypothetical protein
MSGSVRLALYILAGVVAVYVALKMLTAVLGMLMGILIPLAIIGGVGLVVYTVVSRKPLGGRRRYLP